MCVYLSALLFQKIERLHITAPHTQFGFPSNTKPEEIYQFSYKHFTDIGDYTLHIKLSNYII